MSMFWIQIDGNPIAVDDIAVWAEWISDPDNKIVRKTDVGETEVSTVFLGVNHNFRDEGPPILYETLVFGGPLDQEMYRYATREAAEAGHEAMVKLVQSAQAAS